jgi:5-methylcytosine-specific restriction endonuclease McrA
MPGPGHARDGSLPAVSDERDPEPGRPLPASVREPLERAFGAPLADVAVHTDPAAAATADRLHARAYTRGRHIVFGPGRFDPYSPRGKALLAHELSHVLQQRATTLGGGGAARRSAEAETEATSAGALASAGLPAPVAVGQPVGIACADKDKEPYDLKSLWGAAKQVAKSGQESIRSAVHEAVGHGEGVALEVTGLIDTVVALPFAGADAVDPVINALPVESGTKKKIRSIVTMVDTQKPARDLVKAAAEMGPKDPETGNSVLIDPVTKAPALSGLVTHYGGKGLKKIDKAAFGGLEPEKSLLFTDEEIGQLKGSLALQVALAYVGGEEAEIALKVVGGVGAVNGILTAIHNNPKDFIKRAEFWRQVITGVLYVFSLHQATAGRRITSLLLATGQLAAAAGPTALKLQEDMQLQPGPERDAAIRRDVKELALVAWQIIKGVIKAGILRRLPPAGAPPSHVPSPPAPTEPPKKLPPPAPPKKAPPVPQPSKKAPHRPKPPTPAPDEKSVLPPKAVPNAPAADAPKGGPKAPPVATPQEPPVAPKPVPSKPVAPKPVAPKPAAKAETKPKPKPATPGAAPAKGAALARTRRSTAPKAPMPGTPRPGARRGKTGSAVAKAPRARRGKTGSATVKAPGAESGTTTGSAVAKAPRAGRNRQPKSSWAYNRARIEMQNRRQWRRLSRIIRALIPTCEMCQARPTAAADHLLSLKDAEAAMGAGLVTLEQARTASHLSNLAGICTRCNSQKKDRPLGDPRLVDNGWDPPNPNERIKQWMRDNGTGW